MCWAGGCPVTGIRWILSQTAPNIAPRYYSDSKSTYRFACCCVSLRCWCLERNTGALKDPWSYREGILAGLLYFPGRPVIECVNSLGSPWTVWVRLSVECRGIHTEAVARRSGCIDKTKQYPGPIIRIRDLFET